MTGIRHVFVGIVMLLLAAYGAVKAGMYYHARYTVERMLVPISRVLDIHYKDLSVSLFGPVSINGIVVRRPGGWREIHIRRVSLLDYERDADYPLPRHLAIEMRGLRFNVSQIHAHDSSLPLFLRQSEYAPQLLLASDLRALGYDELEANAGLDFRFDRHSGDLQLDWTDEIKKLGSLHLRLAVTGYDPGQRYSRNNRLKFRSAQLVYTDASYLDRVYRLLAEKKGEDAKAYRHALLAQFNGAVARYRIALDTTSLKALQTFIVRPYRLRVSLRPDAPVLVEHLHFYKPGDLPRLLNLQIRADPAKEGG